MVTEDYVSFEIAKLLKEKGFDEPTTKSYYTEGFENPMIFSHDLLPCIRPDEFLCPTQQMAMKWLRKKHNVHIEPRYSPMPNIYRYVIIHSPVTFENVSSHPQYFDTYEQACEAAILYCLENLI